MIKFKWTQHRTNLLGTIPDTVLAEKLGVTRSTVFRKRAAMGISPFQKHFPWDKETESLLGTMSDSALSQKLNISVSTVYEKRSAMGVPAHDGRKKAQSMWGDEKNERLLGALPDREVAEKLGLHKSSVAAARARRGIRARRFDSTRSAYVVPGGTSGKQNQLMTKARVLNQ